MTTKEEQKHTDLLPTYHLSSESLRSKWGFSDGDIMPHEVLVTCVKKYLVPLLPKDAKVYEISTCHNPIRLEDPSLPFDDVSVDVTLEMIGAAVLGYISDEQTGITWNTRKADCQEELVAYAEVEALLHGGLASWKETKLREYGWDGKIASIGDFVCGLRNSALARATKESKNRISTVNVGAPLNV